jgi:hypothetical protein
MNVFEHYGIEHLSPSSLNLFTAAPAAFVLQKVLKRVTSVGAAAHRGTAVETGIVHGLMNNTASLTDCVKKAQEQFALLTAMSGDSKLEKERDAIAGFVEQGLLLAKPLGTPEQFQGYVELKIDGLPIPVIGYYDVKFKDGPLVDFKTTHALPSSPSVPHLRQVSLYMAATGAEDGRIAYITSKKSGMYSVENVQSHIDSITKAALTIQRFLSISKDPMELAGLVVPDVDSFYFNDPITRQSVREVWGL